MSEKLGKWVHESYYKPDEDYAYTIDLGYRQFKVRVQLDKKNWEYVRAMLLGESPRVWSRMIDLTVDVWGGAGPDFRTQPA